MPPQLGGGSAGQGGTSSGAAGACTGMAVVARPRTRSAPRGSRQPAARLIVPRWQPPQQRGGGPTAQPASAAEAWDARRNAPEPPAGLDIVGRVGAEVVDGGRGRWWSGMWRGLAAAVGSAARWCIAAIRDLGHPPAAAHGAAAGAHRPGVDGDVTTIRRLALDAVSAARQGRAAPGGAGIASAAAASAQTRVRATRDAGTVRSHRTALGKLERFLQDNVEFGPGAAPPSAGGVPPDAAWDALMEAFVTTLIAPRVEGHPWIRPRGWPTRCSPHQAARTQGAAAAGLARLGWAPAAATLSRTAETRRALGCLDAEEVQRVELILPWEIIDGADRAARGPGTPWHMAARALLVTACVLGSRPGAATQLLLGHVRQTTDGAVHTFQRKGFRHKQQHARATMRGRRTAPALTLEHRALAAHLAPWVRWLRRQGARDSQLLFPSLVRDAVARVRTVNGRLVEGGLWMEPLQSWSARQMIAALDHVLLASRNGRSMQGIRSGANVELRMLGSRLAPGTTAVSDVTRRILQGRSLKAILGSEAAYVEPLAQETREASRQLGSLRIERDPDGVLTLTGVRDATRVDSGWRSVAPTVVHSHGEDGAAGGGGAAAAGVCHSDSSSEEDSGSSSDESSGDDSSSSGTDGSTSSADDSSSSTDQSPGAASASASPRAVLGGKCARCEVLIGKRDHGWRCDHEGCTWTVCPMCHRGGRRAPLRCPRHLAG